MKKIISFLVLGVLAFSLVMPSGRVMAQNSNSSIEDLQKQINQLLELIKNLQSQLNILGGGVTPGVKPPVIQIRPEPERGWDTIGGLLEAQGADGTGSIQMWGTHKITEPTQLTYPSRGGKTYLVKAVNDEVLKELKGSEGQTVTLWGQLQYQNIEGGFWGFVAKKVIGGSTTCQLPPEGTKIGYSGESVKVIQEVLKTDKSIYPEGLVTGYYGSLTAKAVSKFQTQAGLPSTGVLDTETRERIEAKLEATSQSVPGFMGVTTVQVDMVEDRVIRCPIPPTPIPPPTPERGFKVYSPQAGEQWQPGQTYKIAWSQIWPTIINPSSPVSQQNTSIGSGASSAGVSVSNTTFAPIGAVRIVLTKYQEPCDKAYGPACTAIAYAPYVIVDKTDNDGVFEWAIPADIASQYQGKMIVTVSAADGGLSGRSAVFVIGTNTPDNQLKVFSPSAGETWYKGKTYEVRWSWPIIAGGSVGTVTISLLSPCETGYSLPGQPISACLPPPPRIISQDAPNIGSYKWIVPIDLREIYAGKKNIMVSINGMNLFGQSGLFTIAEISDSNKPPVVSGVSGPTVLKIGETGTWTVKAYDPENGSLSYSVDWGFETRTISPGVARPPVQNTATFTHAYNSAGTFTPVFYVTDDKGQQAKTSMSVQVGGGVSINSPPKITAISAIPTPIHVGQQANFSWSATDADGDPLKWNILWGDELVAVSSPIGVSVCGGNNCSASHVWSSPGTYKVSVTVSDGKSGSDNYSFNVNVVVGPTVNQPPVIKTFQFQTGVTSLTAGQMYALNFLATDPEGTPVKYQIEWGDGAVETANMFAAGTTGTSLHTYNTVGTKTLKLTAVDGAGLSATQSFNVNVVGQNINYQILSLNQGWNFISFYRLPDGKDLRGIFTDPWFGYVDVIKTIENGQEQVYDRANNINTLQKIQFDNGYKVYANKAFSMYVYGYLPTEAERKTHLVRNLYNFVGYPSAVAKRTDLVFSSINNAMISAVKDAFGNLWVPGGKNFIGDMKPGQGYEIWINPEFTNNQDIDFTFPQ